MSTSAAIDDSTAARDRWLAERQKGLGASDAPVVLGVSPHKTRYQLWAEKCGLIEAPDLTDKEWVEWGRRLQEPIALGYGARTGRHVSLWPQFAICTHHQRDWQTCTPDATQRDDQTKRNGLLEVKSTGTFLAADWEVEPPLATQVQLQHQLAVTELGWGTMCVLIGGQKLKWFDQERNQRFIDAMITAEKEFWELVQTRTPPEVDSSRATAKALAKLHPQDSGEAMILPNEAAQWDAELLDMKQQIKALEEQKTGLENHLKASIGDATYGVLPDGGRFSWKTSERKGYTVQDTTTRILRRLK